MAMHGSPSETAQGSGPLAGLRVVEFVSIGPGPHCAMMLADLGAEVVRIDRQGGNGWPNAITDRGRATVTVDLRTDEGREYCLGVTDCADVVIEGFRPGVMERLGLGPDVLLERNPKLVFGRITGWGQTGPLAKSAGHDINYIALTGALAAMGRPGEPAQPPLNLVGDFGGGSMLLALGVMSALWERERSGKGQVIDAAIVDGTSHLMSMFAGLLPGGAISMERGSNLLGGAAPFYRCYVCADGKEIAIGPIEPHFYADLIKRIGAPPHLLDEQLDSSRWPEHCSVLEEIFKGRPLDEWCAMLEGSDACFAPVLPLKEASSHPHMAARGVYVTHDGLEQVAPAPRFSRTPGAIRASRDGAAVVAEWQAGSSPGR